MAASYPLLECHDLRKRFGSRTAVDGVSFSIRAGETYGLLGPNGAGKTTSISMVCGLGRFAIAMIQGVFIIVLSAVAFGVNWGDPLAAGLLVVAFALVGTGVAMVIGVFANDADQAGSFGVFAGMLLGALGGAMIPIELFGDQLRALAHLTPHAWAIDGFRTLIFHDGTVVDVLPQLAVLTGMAALFIALGSWGLRRALTHD